MIDTTPLYETHSPVSVTPSAIAEALANYQPPAPKPQEKTEADRLRSALHAARCERDYWKRRTKRHENKINKMRELLNA